MVATSETPQLAPIMRKVFRRLVPFLLLMYVLAFLDRVNIGFAKASFQADTGLSEAAYALGAGIFFVGYALLEVPSNLIMQRVGARLWLARIMVTWGLISAAMAFAHNEALFYTLRVLLGMAEAGFFPGVLLYLTYWVPAQYRGRVTGLFYFGVPVAFIFGGPLSGALLDLDGIASLAGWQWLFIIEGLAASVVGLWALGYLDNRPADARWLSESERTVLLETLREDEAARAVHSPKSTLRTLANPRVLYFALIYFVIQVSVYGVTFYLPTQVAELAHSKVGLAVGLLTAVPWTCALVGTFLLSRLSDRTGERRLLAAGALAVGGVGIAVSAATSSDLIALVALCFAATGFISAQPVFWTMPASVLTGAAAASGIALINSIGNLGGFFAPNIKNAADGAFGAGSGLYVLAGVTALGAVLLLGVGLVGVRGREQTQLEVR